VAHFFPTGVISAIRNEVTSRSFAVVTSGSHSEVTLHTLVEGTKESLFELENLNKNIFSYTFNIFHLFFV